VQVSESVYGLDLNWDAMGGFKDCQEVRVEFMGEQGESAGDTHVVRVVCC